jgi:UPF0755 protein
LERNKKEKKRIKLLSKRELIIIIVFFFIVLGGLYYIFFSPNYYKHPEPYVFEVNRGHSLSQVSTNLRRAGIIPGDRRFRLLAKLYGADKRIRAGRYYIPNGLSYVELMEHLLYGEADLLRKVTVHKGSTVKWLAQRLRREALIDSAEFVKWANNREFLDSIGLKRVNSAEGFMFPSDYYVFERSDAREVIRKFHREYNKFWVDSVKLQAKLLGYNQVEITTLASIIEGETNKVNEMDTISGVYHNRLRIGMKLQADPTVQYLLEEGWRRLLYKDLTIDSPYNTYRYGGLPPSPINNPGRDAMLAALYPAEHNYLFFVADGEGGHKFSRNYSDHLKKVREFRQWLKQRQEMLKQREDSLKLLQQ